MLWKCGDVGTRGECGEVVAVKCSMIRKRAEGLGSRMMWQGCINEELGELCVGSWDEFWMVHWSMRNSLGVADELYIQRALLSLEDFLFFCFYSFSCMTKQVVTLKQL